MPAISDDDTGRMSDAESNASEWSVKRKMIPSMTRPEEAQAERNQSGSNMVPGRHSGKEKKYKKTIPPSRMIQQKFLKLLTSVSKKSQQFSPLSFW